ncbi:hypothetical protein [Pleionea sp. CnH1-48]|uniref:hypothetical protein n=1 Tax=Pleionea sp. CnH1-48 TaxID=2954494 RepID=UPI0020970789|nr:hypothetical protein [Pleionea sp. CnH1-48]MCO7223880.1 hypothetical protein [Pleionea sp. CnH1-48]
MKIFATAIALLLSSVSGSTYAASGEFSGNWTITLDKTLDNYVSSQLVYTFDMNSHHNMFTAVYTGINNDSFLEGRTYFSSARTTQLIQAVHVDSTYYRVYSGKKVAHNHYEGVWYDNAGQSGDFRLKK